MYYLVQAIPMRTTISLLLCLSAFSLQGQEFRIGYINCDSVIASLPEVQRIEKQLDEYSKKFSIALQQKTSCYPLPDRTLLAELDSTRREELEREIELLESERLTFVAQTEAKYEQKRVSLMQPIYERFAEEVNKVARELSLVLIVHTDLILYGKENAVDITAEVLGRLE